MYRISSLKITWFGIKSSRHEAGHRCCTLKRHLKPLNVKGCIIELTKLGWILLYFGAGRRLIHKIYKNFPIISVKKFFTHYLALPDAAKLIKGL